MAKASRGEEGSAGSVGSSRADQSVQAFREALEKSVTISRDRLQEVIDDAVAKLTRSGSEPPSSRRSGH